MKHFQINPELRKEMGVICETHVFIVLLHLCDIFSSTLFKMFSYSYQRIKLQLKNIS